MASPVVGSARSTCRLEVDASEYRRLIGAIGLPVNVTMGGKRWSEWGFDLGSFEHCFDDNVGDRYFVTMTERRD